MSMNTNPNSTSSNSGQTHHHSHHVYNAPLGLASTSSSSVPSLTASQVQANSMKPHHHHYQQHHHHNYLHNHYLAGLSNVKSNVAQRTDSNDHHPANNQFLAVNDLSANVSSNSPLSCSHSSHHFNFLNGSLLLFILDQIDFLFFVYFSFLFYLFCFFFNF